MSASEGSGRTLVLAGELADQTRRRRAVRAVLDDRPIEVLVVAPAFNSLLRRWTSDEDEARRRAEARLVHWLRELDRAGVAACGQVGDADPLQAIADALPTFRADRIVVAGLEERPARDLLARATRRFDRPVAEIAGLASAA